jgi:hypothetical protein
MKSLAKPTILLCLLHLTFLSHASTPHIDIDRTRHKAKEAKSFCGRHNYNTRYCILIDMSLPSGVKRFIVWDFKRNDTLFTGMVSHGCGINPWMGTWSKNDPTFSNLPNSHCTSLGKYMVSSRAGSAWGIRIKYFLIGLDATNSNAYKRDIVLHSWEQVPDKEIYPDGTPEDWGCPAVSNATMKKVDALLRRQRKHLLLWIYD